MLPDIIDWLLFRAILKKPAIFHPFIDKIRDTVLGWAPNLNHTKWAILIEIGILGLLFWVLF